MRLARYSCDRQNRRPTGRRVTVSLLWIILIVILVLALLGFFTRGRW
jgi:flagellar basal body-associated protein FliL